MTIDVFGYRCEICPDCGKIAVEVETGVLLTGFPPRVQLQQRCMCGWSGDLYDGPAEEAHWPDWEERWEAVNQDPRMKQQVAVTNVVKAWRESLYPAIEIFNRAMRQIVDDLERSGLLPSLRALAERWGCSTTKDDHYVRWPNTAQRACQARKRWRRRMLWERSR